MGGNSHRLVSRCRLRAVLALAILLIASGPFTDRTARAQLTSRQNSWGKGVTDVDWVYGYNAWTAPLAGNLLDDRPFAVRARQ